MAKKYSVNIEDDQVVSMEVNGVQYQSVEDIPDPEDREKINRLLASSMDEDADKAFEREFKQDLEEMERGNRKFSLVFTAVFVVVALILFAIAIISGISTSRALAKEKEAPGTVVDLVEHSSYNSETKNTTTYSYPVVQFMLSTGAIKKVELSEGSWPPSYATGDKVTILYDPDQPRNARIKSTSSNLLQWLVTAITGFLGVVFMSVGLAVGLTSRGKK